MVLGKILSHLKKKKNLLYSVPLPRLMSGCIFFLLSVAKQKKNDKQLEGSKDGDINL